jgi:preprotein translocase subunit SecY
MVDRLRGIWASPDLRKKILFTIGMLIIYRLISHIPVPGIDPSKVSQALNNPGNQSIGQVLGLLSVFSGGSVSYFSIVTLGVYPYITASIVVQLLQPIIPALDRLQREGGEAGRNQLSQITRYLTVPLAFLQGFGQLALFGSIGAVTSSQFGLFSASTFLPTLTALLAMTGGVMFLVWIGEVITENGIGNGISLIIFTGILSGIPPAIANFFLSSGAGSKTSSANAGTGTIISLLIAAAIIIALVMLIVLVTMAERRVPVQYPTKRMIGRRSLMESRQNTYIPLRVNMGGMIPLIFAQSLLIFPVILASYLAVPSNPVGWVRNLFTWLQRELDPSNWIYPVAFFLFVVAFTFFYATVLWEQQNTADNLRKQGAFIAGVRPGPATNEYLSKILMRITLWGALFLALIAIMPFIFPQAFKLSRGALGGGGNGLLTAASLIIIVQVAIDTVRQVQSQLVMRNYSGFLR